VNKKSIIAINFNETTTEDFIGNGFIV
jgi:hypothetical protein